MIDRLGNRVKRVKSKLIGEKTVKIWIREIASFQPKCWLFI